MSSLFLVFFGAGFGGALRHAVNVGSARAFGAGFPWSTLTVNVTGSFLMGGLAAWLAFRAEPGWSEPVRLFLATGILGGFTTFSAFSLDAVLLWERGNPGLALLYAGGSVLLSIVALAIGLALVRALAS